MEPGTVHPHSQRGQAFIKETVLREMELLSPKSKPQNQNVDPSLPAVNLTLSLTF